MSEPLAVRYFADTGEKAPVTFWTGGWDYARYVRAEMPAKVLGAAIADPALRPDDPLSLQEGEVAVWQRVGTLARANLIAAQKEQGIRTILETDDDYTRLHRQHGWVEKLHPNFPQEQACVELHRMVAGVVDRVIVSTPHLAEVYSELNKDVVVCRNSVDPNHWPRRRDKTDDRMVFAWIASSDHIDERPMASRAFEPLKHYPNVRCVWFGVKPFAKDEHIEYVEWTDSWSDWRQTATEMVIDVGVAPLNDAPMNLSRSDLKALEYAALGALPLVQDHEAYRGLHADMAMKTDVVSWPSSLEWCARHPEEVRMRAAMACVAVFEQRSIYRAADDWRRACTFV